jgi:H+-translocating NAD(P) transhydrogenase subunit alpha
MSITAITELYVFILAGFLGYQLVTRVPPLLHTPLMSATNAICGISLVGALMEAGSHESTVSTILGVLAVTSATINVVGGFLMTDRMLSMFKHKPEVSGPAGQKQLGAATAPIASSTPVSAPSKSASAGPA